MKVDRSSPNNPNYVERIHAFDLLRGYFLIIILIDHLAYFPSGLDVLTGRGILYASSAEGFFLISGIVLGIVRGRKLIEKPLRVAYKLLFKRSIQLYLTSIILTFLFTLIGWAFFMGNPGLKYGIADPSLPLPQLLWNIITFQYTYGWADFLRFYALFIALTPIALWLIRRGFWYIVMVISLVIWWCYNLTTGGEFYAPLAWQFVFISGFTIGYYWPVILSAWRRLSLRLRTAIGVSFFTLFVVTAAASAVLVFGDMLDIQPWVKWHGMLIAFFNKDQLPIPRLVLGTIWFWGLFWIVRRFESTIIAYLGWLIMPLGVNSLYVYTIQAFIIFFFHLFLILPQSTTELAPWYVNLMLTLVALGIVWAMTKRQILFKVIPR